MKKETILGQGPKRRGKSKSHDALRLDGKVDLEEFYRQPEMETTPLERLHFAMLITALKDLGSRDPNRRNSAMSWFFRDETKYPLCFAVACDVLKVETEVIKKRAHQIALSGGRGFSKNSRFICSSKSIERRERK